MATGRERKTIDGWLLVFLALCVLTALIYLVIEAVALNEVAAFERRFGPEPQWLHLWNYCLALPRIGLPLLVVWRMVADKRWGTVRFAVAIIWLLFIGLPIIDIAVTWQVFGIDRHFLVRFVVPQLARGVFFAGIANLYLLRSKRVENTYRYGAIAEVFD